MLTVFDVAERLKVTPLTVRRWIKAKKLKGIQIGRNIRIEEAELTRFIQDQNKD